MVYMYFLFKTFQWLSIEFVVYVFVSFVHERGENFLKEKP